MLTAFDLLLIVLAFVLVFRGLSGRWSAWKKGREEDLRGDWAGLFGYILGHGKILKKRMAGMAHLALFWGVLIPPIIILLAQFALTLPPVSAAVLSLLLDILGAALLAGSCFFLVRRLKTVDPRGPQKVLAPICLLLIILITGFLAEGTRLRILHPEFSWISPVGSLLSLGLPSSPLLMAVVIRLHFLFVLLLIALVPFTYMRHLAAVPLNVFYKRRSARGALRGIALERGVVGARTAEDFSWKQLLDAEACVSCGRCEENCPASISGKPLSPRKVIQDILELMARPAKGGGEGLESRITGDEIWSCTTCMACVEHCPVFIEPMDKIIDIRRYQLMGKGQLPAEARPMLRNLEIYGDVHGRGASHRRDWALNRHVPLFPSKDARSAVLLWVGCAGAFHPRVQEVTRAMVKILKTARIPFGILGKEERCCGDPARRLGREDLFLELARRNIRELKAKQVTTIVSLCPHCFNTLKNEYPRASMGLGPDAMGDVDVIHATAYVLQLIEEERLFPKYPLDRSITFHDPCYLGRINGVYEAPREVLRAVPGLRFKALKREQETGFCCGGGGGGMWLHEHLGRRMNVIRAEEVSKCGAELLGTACPYCLTMLEDGITSLEEERSPKVLDLVEIVASSIG